MVFKLDAGTIEVITPHRRLHVTECGRCVPRLYAERAIGGRLEHAEFPVQLSSRKFAIIPCVRALEAPSFAEHWTVWSRESRAPPTVAAAAPAHRRVVRDGGRAHREVLSALEAMSGEESPGSPHAGRLPARADRAGRAAARRRAAPDLIRQRCSQPVPKARRAVLQPAAATSGSRAVNDGHGLHITFRAPFSTTQFAVGPERVISNPFPERLDGELGERGVTPAALLGQTPAGGRRGRLYGASAVLTGKRRAPARVCGFHTPTGGKPEGGGCAAVSSESSRMTRVRLLLSTRRGTLLVTKSPIQRSVGDGRIGEDRLRRERCREGKLVPASSHQRPSSFCRSGCWACPVSAVAYARQRTGMP